MFPVIVEFGLPVMATLSDVYDYVLAYAESKRTEATIWLCVVCWELAARQCEEVSRMKLADRSFENSGGKTAS